MQLQRCAVLPASQLMARPAFCVKPGRGRLLLSATASLPRRLPETATAAAAAAAASAAFTSLSPESSTTARPQKLAHLSAKQRTCLPAAVEHDAGADLDAYMRLPVSQYVLVDLPLGGQLARVGEDVFELTVPRLRFFDVWVQPRMLCSVRQYEGQGAARVDIRSLACLISGSPFVERARLAERVQIGVRATLTWRGPDEEGGPAIECASEISATVDPPAPFSLLPTRVLEATGNAVMQAALASLQQTFVRNLSRDYAAWATSEEARAARREFAEESQRALEAQPAAS